MESDCIDTLQHRQYTALDYSKWEHLSCSSPSEVSQNAREEQFDIDRTDNDSDLDWAAEENDADDADDMEDYGDEEADTPLGRYSDPLENSFTENGIENKQFLLG